MERIWPLRVNIPGLPGLPRGLAGCASHLLDLLAAGWPFHSLRTAVPWVSVYPGTQVGNEMQKQQPQRKQTNKKMMFTAWKYLCEQKNRETLHPSSWGKEDKSQEKGLLRPSQSMCPSRQSWAAVQLSRTGCDFNMRFCSLGFSNQKATAFCTVCLLCLSQGSGKELACIRNLLCITLRPAPSARHHLYLLCPRHFRVCWKGSGEGKESGEVEAETEWVRNLNYINCFCT